MQRHKIKAIRGYKKAPWHSGCPFIITPNHLQREFTVDVPNKVWVTGITYIRTWQGWLFLVVLLGLYARKVVVWPMKPTLGRGAGTGRIADGCVAPQTAATGPGA